MNATDALLTVRDLHMSIREPERQESREILHGVTFDLARGESLALVGESGSGKSMTARSIIRLLPENAEVRGSLTFGGDDVLAMNPAHLRQYRSQQVSMIFQDPHAHLDQTWTIGDFLQATLALSGTADPRARERRAVELLESVHIDNAPHRMRQYPYEVSGGMLQRVMIASALASDPVMLLADEPTTALDVTVQAEIVRILGELRQRHGLALLFITHDLELAEAACDRMAVMYAGRIVETLPVRRAESMARHPYTIGLLGSRPDLASRSARLRQLPGRPILAHEAGTGCSFVSRCELATQTCRTQTPRLEAYEATTAVACLRADESRALLTAARGPVPAGEADRPASDDHMVIRTRQLRRVFGRTTALDAVSFTVRRGESLAVVGESGSGKTTLARLLVGLDRPTSGSVEIDGHARRGRRLDGLSLKDSAGKAQIVFQDPYGSLDPRQKIGTAISEVVRFTENLARRQARVRTEELLDLVGLDTALADRYPRRLSGGQRQRVAIARALAARPEVLVLDEAVAALDVSIQAQILNLLADLRDQLSMTYVFITHDLAVVRQVADRVLVMHHGSVIETGEVDQVLSHPVERYTATLVASSPSRLHRTAAADGGTSDDSPKPGEATSVS